MKGYSITVLMVRIILDNKQKAGQYSLWQQSEHQRQLSRACEGWKDPSNTSELVHCLTRSSATPHGGALFTKPVLDNKSTWELKVTWLTPQMKFWSTSLYCNLFTFNHVNSGRREYFMILLEFAIMLYIFIVNLQIIFRYSLL